MYRYAFTMNLLDGLLIHPLITFNIPLAQLSL